MPNAADSSPEKFAFVLFASLVVTPLTGGAHRLAALRAPPDLPSVSRCLDGHTHAYGPDKRKGRGRSTTPEQDLLLVEALHRLRPEYNYLWEELSARVIAIEAGLASRGSARGRDRRQFKSA